MTDKENPYLLHSIERVEAKLDSLSLLLKEHMDREDTHMDEVSNRLTRTERDIKWHSRIGGGSLTALGALFSWILFSSKP